MWLSVMTSQLLVMWLSLEQLAHLTMPAQASQVWPYSWHLRHLIESWISLWTFTNWSLMQIQPVIRRLVASGLAQSTFSIVVFWLGDLSFWLLVPRGRDDGIQGNVILYFDLMQVSFRIWAELTWAGNKVWDYCIGAEANLDLWAEFW